jgi:F-type H+-transporting ATPase subunit delta
LSAKGTSRVVARRYARALLDVVQAGPGGAAEGPAAVRAALERSVSLLAENPELMRALTHPGVPGPARKKVVAAVWAQAPEAVKRLVQLLVERDRVPLLHAITEAYAEVLGVVEAAAVSAVELDAPQKQALSEALEKATGKGVELNTRVDASVLGGLRVSLGGRTFDGTVQAQLAALRRRLSGAA